MFASPALLNRVGEYGKKNRIKLPSIKRVISAGAPVSPSIIKQFSSMLCGDAQIHTPYGATEAVPIISITSNEILSETRMLSEQGYGICIGRPINDLKICIIKVTDDPIDKWSEDLTVPDGEIGEIVSKATSSPEITLEDPSRMPWPRSKTKIPFGTEWGIWGGRIQRGGYGSAAEKVIA